MRYFFIFLAAGIVAACGNADKKPSLTERAKQDSATMAALKDTSNYTTLEWLDSVDQNLGKINEGQVIEITWRFKNTGDKPLVIARVQPGCGCTVAELPKEPIAPGKEGIIKAKFDSKGHPNTQYKDVYVFANNRNKNFTSTNQLKFKVDVQPK